MNWPTTAFVKDLKGSVRHAELFLNYSEGKCFDHPGTVKPLSDWHAGSTETIKLNGEP